MDRFAGTEDLISLESVTSASLPDVDAVFDDLTGYACRVDGVSRRANAARDFMTAVPPGHALQNKHAFVARHGQAVVGLLDVIDGYPALGTVFIGLLAIRESMQGSGLGRALFQEAERLVRDTLGARIMRLAVVETNPVAGFWMKMGFRPTGEVRPFEGEASTSCAILMEKRLQPVVSSSAS